MPEPATELRDLILALGYQLHGTCQVGVVSDHGDGDEENMLPIIGWRGLVRLVFRTTTAN
jgi:hypothetical protein